MAFFSFEDRPAPDKLQYESDIMNRDIMVPLPPSECLGAGAYKHALRMCFPTSTWDRFQPWSQETNRLRV